MILSERTRTISVLGIVQIFAWGSSFYLLAVLAAPVEAETGWSAGLVSGGLSVGLLAAGLVSRRVGRVIQAQGGRRVLSTGMGLIALGLVIMALAQSEVVYLLAWLLTGIGMGAGLYDAAFSTLGRIYGAGARGAITALTLWGGFASTVCWPISAFLVEALGWRGTCLAYAALHLCVTLPLCWFALPRVPPELAHRVGGAPEGGRPAHMDPRFWCMALTGILLAVLSSLWMVHLMSILTSLGHSLAAAVSLGALIGPAQVGARVVEMMGRGRHHPIWTLLVSTGLILFGFAGLELGLPAAAALIAFGGGNGLWSIARGALPLAVFGPEDYARIMGQIAMPVLLASSAAPLAGAVLVARIGPEGTLGVLIALSLAALAVSLTLYALIRRDRQGVPG